MSAVSHVRLFVTPWTVAHQPLLSMEFSKQRYWSKLPFLTPGDLPHQGSNPHLLCLLQWLAEFLPYATREAPCKPYWIKFRKYINTLAQSLSHVQHFVIPWTTSCQASLSFTISEFAQIHVHWVGDSIQTSHPLPTSSTSALNLSQQQDPLQLVGSLHQVAKVLVFQHQSFQWIFRVDFL